MLSWRRRGWGGGIVTEMNESKTGQGQWWRRRGGFRGEKVGRRRVVGQEGDLDGLKKVHPTIHLL